jgi:hypothetical protein
MKGGVLEKEFESQGRPLAVHPLPLNFPDLALAYGKALGNQPPGMGHAHFVILGIHEGEKNLLAAIFRQWFVAGILGHGQSPSGLNIADVPSNLTLDPKRKATAAYQPLWTSG